MYGKLLWTRARTQTRVRTSGRAQTRVRVAFGTGIGAVALTLAPIALAAPATGATGPSVTVTPGTAKPGDVVAIRGSGLTGCALNKVDVYLLSANGGSSGEYQDLLAADLPVDTAHGNSIAFRHEIPAPVYSSNAEGSIPGPVNRIAVRCNGEEERALAQTPIEIDSFRPQETRKQPADLSAKRLILEPAAGAPGTEVTLWTDLHCGNANASDDARVTWGGRDLTKLSVQSTGSKGESYRFTVPDGPDRGPQPVTVSCFAQGAGMPDNGVTLRTDFLVAQPELTLTPTQPTAGRPLRIAGSGFVACGRPVDGGAGSLTVRHGTTVLGTVPVAGDGRFAGELRVPRELPGGDGTLTVACATGAGYDGDFSVRVAVLGAARTAAPATDRSEAAVNLPSPNALFDEPRPVLLAGATAVVALPVLGFSAELFNKTWEQNHLRIRRRLRPGAARPRSQPRLPELQVLTFVLLSAAFCVAVEPGTGWNAGTAALALALVAAVPLGVLVYEGSAEAYRRRVSRIRALPRLLPGALGVALVLAAASRMLHLTPGYVYGLFLAFTSAGLRRMSPADEGRAIALGSWSLAGLAVVAWVWRIPVTHVLNESDGAPFGWVFAEDVLTQCFVAAVVGLVFGLLPMRFMDGHALWQWNRWAWAAIYALAVFLFILALLDPTGAADGITRAMWLRSTILFTTAALASLTFWAIFRLRPPRTT
ncbi:FGLLP motif-containing membrane protein [Embleya sp. NPDC008237]|uniref:FGLLP motif-containing membrane protein n=1 Tax=Embleya sp. NPDC008237 TaxID=3363978 RepID=UPI0036EC069A